MHKGTCDVTHLIASGIRSVSNVTLTSLNGFLKMDRWMYTHVEKIGSSVGFFFMVKAFTFQKGFYWEIF